MKIHSLKLTIQDVPNEEGELFAGVFGSIVVDTGEVAKNEDGTNRLDEDNVEVPILEDIQFIFPLDKDEVFKGNIQAIVMEALTLKNWQIAKENGQLSHFIEAVGANTEEGEGLTDKPTADEDIKDDSKE
jgi:hypothetical protein